MKRRTTVCIAALTATLVLGFQVNHVKASVFRPCHDDSNLPHHWGSHGDPNKGFVGAENGDHGYYYLSIEAGCQASGLLTGDRLVGHVHLNRVVSGSIDADGMCWRLDIDHKYDHKHKLLVAVLMGTSVSLTYSRGILGQDYRLRVANLEPGLIVTDHSTFDG